MQLLSLMLRGRSDDLEAMVPIVIQQRSGIAEVLLDANDLVKVEVLIERHLIIVVFRHYDLGEVMANAL